MMSFVIKYFPPSSPIFPLSLQCNVSTCKYLRKTQSQLNRRHQAQQQQFHLPKINKAWTIIFSNYNKAIKTKRAKAIN